MSLVWRSSKAMFGAGMAVQRSAAVSAGRSMAERQANRGARAARQGLIGPFDPPPPPHVSGYLDYSGLATPGDITTGGPFPIGRYVLPRKRWRAGEPLSLPDEVANRHTAVLGPTRRGKTASLIAPWIHAAVEAGYLVVAVDVKGNNDLVDTVGLYSMSQPGGGAFSYASFDYRTPAASVSWNWIADLPDDSAVNAAAEALVGRDRENDPNREFRMRDLTWMRGLLKLLNATGTLWTVRSALELLDDQERLQFLVSRQKGEPQATALGDLVWRDPDDYARMSQFLRTYLEPLNTEGFVRTTRMDRMRMDDLLEANGFFVVNAPWVDGKLSEAASGLFFSQFLNRRLQMFNRSGRPVLLVLDEAPRLQKRIDIPGLLSLAAGAGVSVLLAAQDVTQFPESERDVIFNNCGTWVLMPGCGEATTRYFGARLGTRQATQQTQSASFGRDGRTWQTGHQSATVPVLGHAELASPPGGPYTAIVHSYDVSRKPVLVDLTRQDLLEISP